MTDVVDLKRVLPVALHIADLDNPFVAAVIATPMAMLITDPLQFDNPIVFANEAFCTLTGYDAEEIIGRNCRFLQGPKTDPDSVAQVSDALKHARAIQIDLINYRKSGTAFWNRLQISPVLGSNGELRYFCASQLDVTLELERLVNMKHEAEVLNQQVEVGREDLNKSEQRLQYIVSAARIGYWVRDLQTDIVTGSDTFKNIFGFTGDADITFRQILDMVSPESQQAISENTAAIIANGGDYHLEYQIDLPDGEKRWIEARGHATYDTLDNPTSLVGVVIDITERKNVEFERSLLTRELAHRVKNTMATVQSIANQTLRHTADIEEAKRLFNERLRSLAAAHDVLIHQNWSGATIEHVANSALAPFLKSFSDRIFMSGPEIAISERVIVSLSLGLHELATNAVKYGALSNESGVILFDWAIENFDDSAMLLINWVESGGPEVRHPNHRGFGQRLLRSVLAVELNGECDIEFLPSGIAIQIRAPWEPTAQ